MIPFAEFAPDQGDYRTASRTIAGVIPLTVQNGGVGYGPLAGAAAVSDAASASRIIGASAGRDEDGNVRTFCADASTLYELSGATWSDVSKSGGYSVAADEFVEFAQYGDRLIAAMGVSDALQAMSMTGGTAFADLAAAAPRAKHIAVVNSFVVVGNTFDSVDGNVPNRVWWSAIGDPTDWPTVGSADAAEKQSDYQDLPRGGPVQKIIPAIGGADALVFCERAIYRMTYVGAPATFAFDTVEDNRGTPAPQSVVGIDDRAFYISDDGFYMTDGARSLAIGAQRVDKTFFAGGDTAAVDQTYLARCVSAVDPINKLVFFSYVPSGQESADNVFIYNWSIDKWAFASSFAGSYLYSDLTLGTTMEGLDSVSASLDALPASLDSRIWTGGKFVLSVFKSDGKLYRYTGDNVAATLATIEDSGAQGERVFVQAFRPYIDATGVTVVLKARESLSGSETDLPDASGAAVGDDGKAYFDQSTRYFRFAVKVPAATSWSHAQGGQVYAQADGEI